MQTLKLVLIATAALVLGSHAVRAAAIVETFMITVSSAQPILTGFSSSSYPQFNPSLGTLTSVVTALTGPATWTSAASSPRAEADLLGPAGFLIGSEVFTTPGAIDFDLSGTNSFTLPWTGTGSVSDVLTFTDTDISDTFATSGAGLVGTTTYNFTPAVVIREPNSLALIGAGLVGLAFAWRRKNRSNS